MFGSAVPDIRQGARPLLRRVSVGLRAIALLGLLSLLVTACVPAASAQTAAPGRSFALVTAGWDRTFDAVERALRGASLSEAQRREFDGQLSAILQDAGALQDEARREIEEQTRLLETLGPAPAEGQPPEPRDLARERKDISEVIGLSRARLAQAELGSARAVALQEQLATAVRRRFVQRLLQRDPPPLAPGVLTEGLSQWGGLTAQMATAPLAWYAAQPEDERTRIAWLLPGALLPALLVVVALRATLLAGALRHWAPAAIDPSPGRRLLVACLRTAADGILPAVIIAAPVLTLLATTDYPSEAAHAAALPALAGALALLFVGTALARASLAPADPRWGTTALQPGAGRHLCRCVVFLQGVLAAAVAIRWAQAGLTLAPALHAVQALAFCTAGGIGIVLACRGRAWRISRDIPDESPGAPLASAADAPPVREALRTSETAETDDGKAADGIAFPPGRLARAVRRSVAAAAIIAPIACAAGFTRLGVTIINSILLPAIVIGLALLVRSVAREAFGKLLASAIPAGGGDFTTAATRTILVWARALLDPALVALGVWALAPLWGVPRDDLARWALSVLTKFTIGGVTVSLADLALAAVVLLLALAAARSFRRALAERLLPRTRLDASVQHSISVGSGYVGVVIAVLLAVAVIGLDLSNIALVAGALSVGIGFGLQNIVNNFVSGLILLIERPVKVGDWVVVGGQEGYVRRINVRSTELETFQRATVILPNSELLSNPVVNWTHKDKVGRVDVRISVDYAVDTEAVRDVLLACARAHPDVLGWPAPFVLFLDFGDSALVFELRAFLRDVEKRLRVGSDLRFAIEQACREAGIAFPYPQHDVHLRDMDRLEAALATLAPKPVAPDPRRPRRR